MSAVRPPLLSRRHGRQWPDDSTRTGVTSEESRRSAPPELMSRYLEIVNGQSVSWTEHHHLIRLLGTGGHGAVYLSEGRGTDMFNLPVALKIFAPLGYESEESYSAAMRRIASTAGQVARIQQDNLVNFHHWFDLGRIRILEMEWIDGFDLRCLLSRKSFARVRSHATEAEARVLRDRTITLGGPQLALKPGVAVSVVRGCLGALAALHAQGIVHGDVKPSNIMLKRTGPAKLIDLAAAFRYDDPPPSYSFTPLYAAPELLNMEEASPQSDLAGLGYVLVEMLSGVSPFAHVNDWEQLREEKCTLQERLPEILPDDVVRNDLLMDLCYRLVAADPADRYASAAHADSENDGASAFHRQLVKADLASEYETDIGLWLKYLGTDD